MGPYMAESHTESYTDSLYKKIAPTLVDLMLERLINIFKSFIPDIVHDSSFQICFIMSMVSIILFLYLINQFVIRQFTKIFDNVYKCVLIITIIQCILFWTGGLYKIMQLFGYKILTSESPYYDIFKYSCESTLICLACTTTFVCLHWIFFAMKPSATSSVNDENLPEGLDCDMEEEDEYVHPSPFRYVPELWESLSKLFSYHIDHNNYNVDNDGLKALCI